MKAGRLVTIATLLMSCVGCVLAQPQAPNIEWSHTYGGDSSDSFFSGIIPMPDGGYMLGGSIYPYGAGVQSDMLLMRTSAVGDCVWSERYGTIYHEVCLAMSPTADGGFVLAGTGLFDGAMGFDFMLLKGDAQGDCLWSHTYGRPVDDACYAVRPTPDGGYLLAGETGIFNPTLRGGWLVKTDANGDSLWSRVYGEGGQGGFVCVRQTADQNFVLAGTISSDFWLMKIDQSGDSLWSRTYGGAETEGCESVQQTADGGFVLAGSKLQGMGDWDFWLVKTDANGDSLWSCAYGGEDSDDVCYDIVEMDDGGYVLIGLTGPTTMWSYDGLVIRTNADGDSLWSLRFGDANYSAFTTTLRTADGGLVLGGYTQTDITTTTEALLVKTGPELLAGDMPVAQSVCLLSNYPNPFNPTTILEFALPRTSRVTIRAYDLLGREVDLLSNAVYPAGAHTVAWTPRNLASGTYWISLTGDGFQLVRKTILLR